MDCLKERGKKPGIFQHGYFTLDSRKTVEIINFHVFFWGVKQLCSVPCLQRKPLSRLIKSCRALLRERAKEMYLPTTWGREEASISSIIEPFSIHVLNSNKLCRDNVATWGLLHRSPPCSTFSSNFIHLQEGRAMRLCWSCCSLQSFQTDLKEAPQLKHHNILTSSSTHIFPHIPKATNPWSSCKGLMSWYVLGEQW